MSVTIYLFIYLVDVRHNSKNICFVFFEVMIIMMQAFRFQTPQLIRPDQNHTLILHKSLWKLVAVALEMPSLLSVLALLVFLWLSCLWYSVILTEGKCSLESFFFAVRVCVIVELAWLELSQITRAVFNIWSKQHPLW